MWKMKKWDCGGCRGLSRHNGVCLISKTPCHVAPPLAGKPTTKTPHTTRHNDGEPSTGLIHRERPPSRAAAEARRNPSHQRTQRTGFVAARRSWAARGLSSGRFAVVARCFCDRRSPIFISTPPVNPTLRFWPIVPPTKTFGGNEMFGVFVDKICNSHR